jgi:hypothetical protein
LASGNGESLGGCHEAEAFARRLFILVSISWSWAEVRAAMSIAPGRKRRRRPLTFLDTAFLPGCMGIAEPGDDAVLAGEMIIGQELGAAIEGDAATRLGRKVGERRADRSHDAGRTPVAVPDQAGYKVALRI